MSEQQADLLRHTAEPTSAVYHVMMPLAVPSPRRFRRALAVAGYTHDPLDLRFYLRYVQGALEGGAQARIAVLSRTLGEALTLTYPDGTQAALSLCHARIFEFRTGIALFDLVLRGDTAGLAAVADTAAVLRIVDGKGRLVDAAGAELTLLEIAERLLPEGGYTAFPNMARGGSPRADVLTSVVTSEAALAGRDRESDLCRIADTMSASYTVGEAKGIYSPYEYLHWAVTSKGACALAVLNDRQTRRERGFVHAWHKTVDERHTLWYAFVLHQRHAMYYYLGGVSGGATSRELEGYRRKVVAFNTGYRFEAVSEIPDYQLPYDLAREQKTVERVFCDADEEIERLNSYRAARRDGRTAMAMAVVSIVCLISTLVDICLLGEAGSLAAFTPLQWALFAVFGAATLGALCALVFPVLLSLIAPLLHRPRRK